MKFSGIKKMNISFHFKSEEIAAFTPLENFVAH